MGNYRHPVDITLQMQPSMKATLLTIVLLFCMLCSTPGQTRFVGQDQAQYFKWHNQQSQLEQLYTPGTQLHAFGPTARLYQYPSRQSAVLMDLQEGQALINRSDYRTDAQAPEDQIDGYNDIWYRVSAQDAQGRTFTGYIWGAQVAKGWRHIDLTGDGQAEMILLGVATSPRKTYSDIRAEIRILQGNRLLHHTTVDGLCVFEECGSSPMLRIIKDQPYQGAVVLEASTMTNGCFTGIERSFYYWNGKGLQSVFHAEYTMDREYARHPFRVEDPQASRAMLCNYKGQDATFNPVWDCKEVKIDVAPKPVAKKPAVRVRAR